MASKKELERRIEDSSVRLEIQINTLRFKHAVLEGKLNKLMNYLNLELSTSEPTIKKKESK